MGGSTNDSGNRSWIGVRGARDNVDMFYRFAAEVPLRWVDIDSEGVVNNATYLSLAEQARFIYFSELGLLEDHRIPFVLAETTVKFERPGRLGMKIEVAAATTRLGTKSFDMQFEVRASEEVIAKISAVLVFVDDAMRACEIPEDFRNRVAQFEELS